MAIKLNTASWTGTTRKRKLDGKLDDASLLKALGRCDLADANDPAARLEALEELGTQLKRQLVTLGKRSKDLGETDFAELKGLVKELSEEAERQQKQARSAAEAAAAAAAAAADEEDTPALLTTKMLPLVRELRRGEVRMPALIGLAGKNTAVLIMRKPIAPTRRKLLAEQIDAKGGAKYLRAECLLEDAVLTFVVQAPAAGLAKRLRAALMDQLGLRLKVRVRGEDGELELDGEDEAADALDAAAKTGDAATSSSAPTNTAASTSTTTATAAPTTATDASKAAAQAYTQQLSSVRGPLEQALRGQHPEASKLRALAGFASEKAAAGEHKAALQALQRLDDLLRAPLAASTASAASTAASAPAPATRPGTPAPAIVYTQTRLAWVATRGKIDAELKKLEAAILQHYREQPVLPEVTQSVRRLDRVLDLFDSALVDTLDAALNSADADEKARLHADARALITRYQGFLNTDPLVQELDANPFVPIAVQATLGRTLETLAAKIV